VNLKINLDFLVLDCRTAAGNAFKPGKLQQHVYCSIIGVTNLQLCIADVVNQHFSKLNFTQFFVQTAN